jgi:hypothetical protein
MLDFIAHRIDQTIKENIRNCVHSDRLGGVLVSINNFFKLLRSEDNNGKEMKKQLEQNQ